MTPEQVEQIIEYLAKSPFVQSEVEAAKVAIFSFAKAEAEAVIPYGLRTISRLLRWIYKKLKGVYLTMKFNLQRFADEETTTSAETTADAETVAAEVAADEAEATEDSTVTTGSATITVKDSDGNALEGVALAYTVNSATCDGETDSNGQLTVSDLPAGTYSFAATLSGYASGSVDVTVVAAETATGTITLTAESTTTEGESTVSTTTTDVSSAAETAAITSVISSVTSGATEFLERLFTLGDTEADRLEAEIKTTTDFFVACRDKIEAVSIRALIAAGRAGEAAAVVLLVTKLKDKIS